MLSTVTAKGQVTIPKDVRDALHIKSNDRVDYIIDEGRAILVPVKGLLEIRGAVPAKKGATIEEERKAARRAAAKRIAEETA